MRYSFPLPSASGLSLTWAAQLVETLQGAVGALQAGKQDVNAPVQLVTVTVAELEAQVPRYRATQAGRVLYVTDDSTGPQPAYADGTTWRRFRDGTPVA